MKIMLDFIKYSLYIKVLIGVMKRWVGEKLFEKITRRTIEF